jgi:hypothetical protein
MKRTILFATALIGASVIISMTTGANNMDEIKFDLGKNIHEIAKKSGAPRFQVGHYDEIITYDLDSIPNDIPIRFNRPQFEFASAGVFGITMYATKGGDEAVERLEIQYRDAFKSHAAAKSHVEALLVQFQAGKWHRYVSPECSGATGRSAILDEKGAILFGRYCSLDPSYRLSDEDWAATMKNGEYIWYGDNMLATLNIVYSDDPGSPSYRIDLYIENAAIKLNRDNSNRDARLKEGDANGWKSTQDYWNTFKKTAQQMRRQEVAAVARGDKITPRMAVDSSFFPPGKKLEDYLD